MVATHYGYDSDYNYSEDHFAIVGAFEVNDEYGYSSRLLELKFVEGADPYF